MKEEKSEDKNSRNSIPPEHPAARNDEWKKVWEKSSLAKPYIETSELQTESALEDVHQKIENQESSQYSQQPGNNKSRVWLLAAVIALFAAGLGYLVMPKQVSAPRGEIITHSLPDGSKIELNSGTEITYNRLYGYFSRTVNLQGEAFFTVANSKQSFRVHTINATISVTGTKFNVRSWQREDETEVAVAEGRVMGYLKKHGSDTVHISAGQKFSLNKDVVNAPDPVDANIDYLTGWRNRLLYIKDRPLWVILDELERRFDIHIEMTENVQQTEPMTVHYVKPDDPESIIADICRVKGLQYSRTANGFIIRN